MKPRPSALAAIVIASLCAAPLGAAPAVPSLINYQGFATNATGAALPDGNYDVSFKIYTASSGGSAIWGEKQVVTLNSGQFSVLLGNGSAIDATIPHGTLADFFSTSTAATGDVFIGLTVNTVGQTTAAEFAPRQQILANPFAHRAKLADVATTVVDASIGSGSLASSSVTSAKIADGTVGAADLAGGAVTSSSIADGTVVAADLAANSVTSTAIADGTVATSDLANAAVTSAKIAPNSVMSSQIIDATITNEDLADGSVTASKLAAGAISSSLIADGSVGTPKLADGSVTEAKIASAAVTGAKVQDDSLTAADVSFADGTSTLDIFPSSGTSGVHMSLSSSAVTYKAKDTVLYPIRFAALSPVNSSTLNTAGLQFSGVAIRMAASIKSDGTVNGAAAVLNQLGNWAAASDRRLKKDIHPADGLLDKALKLRPVWYRFKTQEASEPESMGFIAQEVEEHLPSFVTQGPDHLSLNYAGLSTVAIGAVKEQQTLITRQAERISKLEADNAALARRLDRLEAALKGVAAK